MSRTFSYDRYDSRRRTAPASSRSTLGYWVPLVLTVTIAAGGLAAWVWSSREDHDPSSGNDATSDDENLSYGEDAYNRDPRTPRGVHDDVYSAGARDGGEGFAAGLERNVRDVIRRTPSPQQAFDSARKWGAAGIAAAGATLGGALSAIREESSESRYRRRSSGKSEQGFSDHERWSEEAEKKVGAGAESSREAISTNVAAFTKSLKDPSQQYVSGRRRTVAVVISSDSLLESPQDDGKYTLEHGSVLSQINAIDPATTHLQVLIYNPNPSSSSLHPRAPSSIGSSYAAINTPVQTPGEELTALEPQSFTPGNTTPALSARSSGADLYDILRKQATRLVEDPVQVMPFETAQGWVHMCKHLAPDVLYVVESLSGAGGKHVEAVKGWVGQVVVVVGGDGSGFGGLIDTEDESEVGRGKDRAGGGRWWVDSPMIGLGKGVELVDGARFADDWERRVAGKE